MKTVYTCVAGALHKSEGKECQDIIVSENSNNLSVTVLCDGAGSKKYGAKSAALVAKTAAKSLAENFYCFDKANFLNDINIKLEEAGFNEKNAGTTLIFVAADREKYIIGHLGDGVVLQKFGEDFKVVSKPENGFLANMTYFLPSSNSKSHFRCVKGENTGPTAFILSSDGAAFFLYDPKTLDGYNVCNIFADWAKNDSLDECKEKITINLEQEFSKYSGDDMSIAVVLVD